MRKLLIICNLFHSSPRIPSIVKHLPDFGFQPVVLTIPKQDNSLNYFSGPLSNVVQTDYNGDIFCFWRNLLGRAGFNKKESILNQVKEKTKTGSLTDFFFKWYKTAFSYPDDEKNWIKPAIKAGSELMDNNSFEAIISSSSPVSAHLIASALKKKHQTPWVADLRDLWSQNCDYQYGFFRKIIDKRLELKTLKTADALVAVTAPLAEDLKKLHKRDLVYSLSNGFVENDCSAPLTGKFTITHTGNFYFKKRDPLKLFEAVKQLLAENAIDPQDIEIRLFGRKELWIEQEIKKAGLLGVVKQEGKILRGQALLKQKESQLLFLPVWSGNRGVCSGKIFEYLSAQRPIIAIGEKGSVAQGIIEKTKAGKYGATIEEIKGILKSFYMEYKEYSGVEFHGNWQEVNKYNYKEITRQFVGILNNLYEA